MEDSPAPAHATPGPATSAPATDLVWKGRVVPTSRVAAAYFLGSALLLVAGVAVNYALTGGRWYSPTKSVSSALGDSPTYLTASAYDVTTLLILIASLVGLGAGFLAAYRPTLRSRTLVLFAVFGVGFLLYWALREAGAASRGDPALMLTLAVIFLLLSLVWVLGHYVGTGRGMHGLRAAGFVLFGLYWATQLMRLYTAEEGDFVNAAFAGVAVFGFNYMAYHEMLSIRRGEDPRALHWLAGAAFITTGVYVATHKLQVVSEFLIIEVAKQTTWLLQIFGQDVERAGGDPYGSLITYNETGALGPFPIQIILACTAVQSIMIFVGGILALRPPRRGDGLSGRLFEKLRPTYSTRRLFALLLTVPLIYSLNLFRNVIIIAWSGTGDPAYFMGNEAATAFICTFDTGPACAADDAAFWFSHNVIGKGGRLLALIILAFMVFQILPELYDSIVGLLDLKDRRGPLERWVAERMGRRGNGGTPHEHPASPRTPDGPPPRAPAPTTEART